MSLEQMSAEQIEGGEITFCLMVFLWLATMGIGCGVWFAVLIVGAIWDSRAALAARECFARLRSSKKGDPP